MKTKICFLFSVSSKQKCLSNVSWIRKLWRKSVTFCHTEKSMTNKKAANKFAVPKNTISTWIKNKEKLFQALAESAPSTKKLRGFQYEKVDKTLFEWFVLQRIYLWMDQWSKKKDFPLPKNWRSLTLKHLIGGLKSGKKGRNNFIHIFNLFSGFLW